MFRTRSTQYYEDAEYGSFELPFTGDFYRETLQVSEDGLRAVLGMLCTDDDPLDPFEDGCDEGTFVQFGGSYIHHERRPELEDWKRIIRENPGRVFTHNGTGNWHGPAPLTAKDCRGKKGTQGEDCPAAALDDAGGYYIVPEDATDPAAYAKGMLTAYSDFCNGNVYGVCVWVYTRSDTDSEWELDEESRDSERWGYVGTEYAEQELQEQMRKRPKDTNQPPHGATRREGP